MSQSTTPRASIEIMIRMQQEIDSLKRDLHIERAKVSLMIDAFEKYVNAQLDEELSNLDGNMMKNLVVELEAIVKTPGSELLN